MCMFSYHCEYETSFLVWKQSNLVIMPDLTVCPPENIIEELKNKTFTTKRNDGKMDVPLSRAEEIIRSGKLAFLAQLGTFTVMAQ